jgi:hypothetical protein
MGFGVFPWPGGVPWPGLSGPGIFAKKPTAKDAGYSTCQDLTAGAGYDFVKVGSKIEKDDEFWLSGFGPWTPMNYTPASCSDIGTPVVAIHYPIRRKTVPVGLPKWKCGHGRDPDAKNCVVCAVVYFRSVED